MENRIEFNCEFGIDFVVDQDLPNTRKWNAPNSSYDITCPFCESKRKMNVNLAKNVARCNKCGGNRGYNSVTLHAELMGITSKEAYKDLVKRWEGCTSDYKVAYKSRAAVTESKSLKPAPLDIRDKVYRAFLSQLTLSDRHYQDLKRRGLDDEDIEKGMYKTVPVCGLHSIAFDAVYNTGMFLRLTENTKWGIPGFSNCESLEKVSAKARKNGFFVPVITGEGLISMLQIRYDDLNEKASPDEQKNYKKYSRYASAEDDTGCTSSGCESIHFAGDWTNPEEVYLTEGPLKADIAAKYSGKPFLGLTGVNNVSQLAETLETIIPRGLKRVVICIDMDYRIKKEVQDALQNIINIVNRCGKHGFILLSENTDVRIEIPQQNEASDDSRVSSSESLTIISEKIFPEKVMVFFNRNLVLQKNYRTEGDRIVFSEEFLSNVKSGSYSVNIVEITGEFEKYKLLSRQERQTLIYKNRILNFELLKTGLTYEVYEWDSRFKGIDDFLLYKSRMK